jgi:hypothetical protein
LGIVRAIILILKRHLAVLNSEQPLIAEGDPMGVTADKLDDLVGSAEGWMVDFHEFQGSIADEVLVRSPSLPSALTDTPL